jgi:excisionase family DNA binding protein
MTIVSRLNEPLVTIDELSEYLRVTPRTIHTITKTIGLPRLRVGRSIRYNLSDVIETLRLREER